MFEPEKIHITLKKVVFLSREMAYWKNEVKSFCY